MAKIPPELMAAAKQTTRDVLGVVESHENRTTACNEISTKIQELKFPDVDAKYQYSIRKVLALFVKA